MFIYYSLCSYFKSYVYVCQENEYLHSENKSKWLPSKGKASCSMYFGSNLLGNRYPYSSGKKNPPESWCYVRKMGLMQRGKGRKGRDTMGQKVFTSTEKQDSFIPQMVEQNAY